MDYIVYWRVWMGESRRERFPNLERAHAFAAELREGGYDPGIVAVLPPCTIWE